MKIIVDNQIMKLLGQNPSELLKNPLLSNQISLRWPSLIEYLGFGAVLLDLPAFDETQPLFAATVSTFYATEEKEVLFYVFDRLFTEILNQVRTLPQINAAFLLQGIKEAREQSSFVIVEKILSQALAAYEIALVDNTSNTMHDLILYLAWDRICVWVGRLFNYQSADPKFIQGIGVLKECLIESYQHIAQQGRTSPGIYRMIEALFFYEMREENLQKHTAAEWTMLTQSFPVLKAQNELVDFFYIDDAVIFSEEGENSACYLTLDSPDTVNRRLALAQYTLDKLKIYALQPKKIIYLEAKF